MEIKRQDGAASLMFHLLQLFLIDGQRIIRKQGTGERMKKETGKESIWPSLSLHLSGQKKGKTWNGKKKRGKRE